MKDSSFTTPIDLGQIQAFHRKLDVVKGFDQDPIRNVAYLVEELGEVARAVRRLDRSAEGVDRSRVIASLAEELADCLAYIAKIANYHDIDLEEAYAAKMNTNERREWRELEESHHDESP